MATITLREKPLKDGRLSLYLDIYEDGQRRYEFLKLYIYPETNDKTRAQNRDTRKLAEVVRGKRLVEAQNTAFGFAQKRDKALLLPTFEKFRKGRKSSVYKSIAYHLSTMYNDSLKVSQINERWVQGYVDKLRKSGVCDNSIAEYIALFRVFWRWAVSKGIAYGSPFDSLSLKTQTPVREYLTIEELQRMAQAPIRCKVREAFLFACFTGLRWSDVTKLRWSDVENAGERVRIKYRQMKTGVPEWQDVNEQAVAMMGERKNPEEPVFPLRYTWNTSIANRQLAKWAKSAGVNKHITFHTARHTFATMLLTLGVDLYTVSKLLGHTDITTTQIYAKIVDKKRQEAVDSIPKLL